MPNFKSIALLFILSAGIAFAQSGTGIQQPAHVLGPFATNDCLEANVKGFVVSAGAACGSGSGSGGGGLITYAALSVVLSGGTTPVYVPLGGGGLGSTTEANAQMKVQPAGTFSNVCVNLSAAPGMGNSLVVTLRDGAADTTITMTVSNTATSSCDSTHTVTNSAGDLMDWSLVPSGTIALFTPNVMISAQFGSSSAGGGLAVVGPYLNAGSTYYSGPLNVSVGATLPNSALTTWLNQESSTVTNVSGSLQFVWSGANVDMYGTAAYPATPYTLTCALAGSWPNAVNDSIGIGVTDGTKVTMFVVGTGSGYMNRVLNFTNFNTFGSIASSNSWTPAPVVYLQLTDDGTNFIFRRGTDGVNYETAFTVARGNFLSTPTNIGVVGVVGSTVTPSRVLAFNVQ